MSGECQKDAVVGALVMAIIDFSSRLIINDASLPAYRTSFILSLSIYHISLSI
jgi:hypothetical protein